MEIIQKRRIFLGLGPAATPRPPHAPLPSTTVFLDFRDAAIDCRARNARHFRNERYAATSKGTRLCGRKASTSLLIENRIQRIKALPNQICGSRHTLRLRDAAQPVNHPAQLSIAHEAFLIHLFMQAALARQSA